MPQKITAWRDKTGKIHEYESLAERADRIADAVAALDQWVEDNLDFTEQSASMAMVEDAANLAAILAKIAEVKS